MTPNPRRVRLATLLAAFALILAPAAVALAAPEPSTTAKTRELNPGFDRMFERKAELGLTEDQETRLKQIRKDLHEKNRPLVEQIEGVIGQRPSPEQMKAMSESEREEFVMARTAEGKSHPELQPVYKQIRVNRKAAWQEAKTVLNPDQQAKVEQWAREKQQEMKDKGKRPGPDPGQGKSKSKGGQAGAGAPPESKQALEHDASGR